MSNIAKQPEITIVEVGPRDGLQILKSVMPTEHKKRWIADAAAAGVRVIEVCSFVPAAVVPGMADAAEVVRFARTIPGLTVTSRRKIQRPYGFPGDRLVDGRCR